MASLDGGSGMLVLFIAASLAVLSTASAPLCMTLVYGVSTDLGAGIDRDEVRIRGVNEGLSRRVSLEGVPRSRPLNGHGGVSVSI